MILPTKRADVLARPAHHSPLQPAGVGLEASRGALDAGARHAADLLEEAEVPGADGAPVGLAGLEDDVAAAAELAGGLGGVEAVGLDVEAHGHAEAPDPRDLARVPDGRAARPQQPRERRQQRRVRRELVVRQHVLGALRVQLLARPQEREPVEAAARLLGC